MSVLITILGGLAIIAVLIYTAGTDEPDDGRWWEDEEDVDITTMITYAEIAVRLLPHVERDRPRGAL